MANTWTDSSTAFNHYISTNISTVTVHFFWFCTLIRIQLHSAITLQQYFQCFHLPPAHHSIIPVVGFLVSGCWSAAAPAATTVQWRLGCRSRSDCFLPAPAAMCRVGGPWERARTHGHGSPPGQRARNKGTGVDTTVSPRRTEKDMGGNKRQEERREGPGKWDTYFPGQHEEGGGLFKGVVQVWKVEWCLID